MPALRYAFEEAAASLWRGRRSGAALHRRRLRSRSSCSAAFLLVSRNLERLGDEWSGAAEMSVYLTRRV